MSNTPTTTTVDDYVSPQKIALALKVSPRTVIRNADANCYGKVYRTDGGHRRISLSAALAAHPS